MRITDIKKYHQQTGSEEPMEIILEALFVDQRPDQCNNLHILRGQHKTAGKQKNSRSV